jgi:hypothetical protein
MSAFDQSMPGLQRHQPFPPVWRAHCACWFRVGQAGEIAVCACRSWWRVSKRGRWCAISKRRALRVLLREVRRELACFEASGRWPAG